MFKFYILAWRNVWRNKRRTILTLSIISFGLALFIFADSVSNAINHVRIDGFTNSKLGHLQIHKKDFLKKFSVFKRIKNYEEIIGILNEKKDDIAFTPRVVNMAFVVSNSQSSSAYLTGIFPDGEAKVTNIHQNVISGSYDLGNKEILIGNKLANLLKVGLGDELAVFCPAADGSQGAGLFKIRGIFETGWGDIDGNSIFIHINEAQKIMCYEKEINEIAIKLMNVKSEDKIFSQIKLKLNDEYEINKWEEIIPEVLESLKLNEKYTTRYFIFLLFVVSLSITNTILMSILERNKEFGIMMAIGTKAKHIIQMVFLEGIIVGFSSVVIGANLGIIAVLSSGWLGIPTKGTKPIPSFIYPQLIMETLFRYSIVTFIFLIIVSIYPVWKISKLEPIEILRK